MKEKTAGDVYYTQGEYVTYFDKDFISMDIMTASQVKEVALKVAKEEGVIPKEKSGQGINIGRKTTTLPKRIWQKAYKTITT